MSTMTKAANKVDRHFLSDMWLSETGLTCKATNLSCRTGVSGGRSDLPGANGPLLLANHAVAWASHGNASGNDALSDHGNRGIREQRKFQPVWQA